jgi:hypothetical protein
MSQRYYMLLGSLPHLPHFLRAESLPINPQRLRSRRSALDPEDARDLESAMSLIQWRRHDLAQTDAGIDRQFRQLMQTARNEKLREFVDFRMGLRSAMAGLRLKTLGLPISPASERLVGVGRWDSMIRSRWDREEFGMTPIFPCLPKLRELLSSGSAIEVEKLLMSVVWSKLSAIEDAYPFRFEAVFAYAFKWDILQRWLANDAVKSTDVFKRLMQEVIHEHVIEFA